MAGRSAQEGLASAHAVAVAVAALVLLACQDASGDASSLRWLPKRNAPALVPFQQDGWAGGNIVFTEPPQPPALPAMDPSGCSQSAVLVQVRLRGQGPALQVPRQLGSRGAVQGGDTPVCGVHGMRGPANMCLAVSACVSESPSQCTGAVSARFRCVRPNCRASQMSVIPLPPALPLPMQHDDAVNNASVAAVRAAIAGRQHPNGCPIPVTMFASLPGTSCRLVKEVHSRGWEVADHTLTHRSVRRSPAGGLQPDLAACGRRESRLCNCRAPARRSNGPGALKLSPRLRPHPGRLVPTLTLPLNALRSSQMMNMSRAEMRREVFGARDALAACGIPAADVVGFRAPYLETNRYVRDTLAEEEAAFLYDRCARERAA